MKLDLSTVSTQDIINTYGENGKDTGNVRVQVALLTKKINHLSNHLSTFKKDHNNRTSLLTMVGKRRRLLKYLQGSNLESYRELLKSLKLRH